MTKLVYGFTQLINGGLKPLVLHEEPDIVIAMQDSSYYPQYNKRAKDFAYWTDDDKYKWNNSPWVLTPKPMWLKTFVIKALKYLPLAVSAINRTVIETQVQKHPEIYGIEKHTNKTSSG